MKSNDENQEKSVGFRNLDSTFSFKLLTGVLTWKTVSFQNGPNTLDMSM